MYILGIESSCDETAASIIKMDDNNILLLSNIVATQISTHALYGGVVPEIASREHIKAISYVVDTAIKESKITLSDIDIIGVTYAPGLIGSLLVGVSYAKALSISTNIPLVNVNHIKAHTAAAYINNYIPKSPFISLVASGGHTSIYLVNDPTEFVEIGTTRDDAAGEAFDKVARVIGLDYPGGKEMDKLALEGQNKALEFINLPSPAINDCTLDFSFSGLKTATINHIHNYKQKNNCDYLNIDFKQQIACSFTKVIVDGICNKLDAAINKYNIKDIVFSGGVSANSHLRKGIKELCDHKDCNLIIPEISLCGDNGAMVAVQAYFEYKKGKVADSYLNALATGDVSIN